MHATAIENPLAEAKTDGRVNYFKQIAAGMSAGLTINK
jgi:hypothetical protein